MKLLLTLFAVATLSGCAAPQPGSSPQDKLRQLSFAEISRHAAANAKFLQTGSEKALTDTSLEAARTQMKDPGSTQFRNVRVVTHSDGKLVCGEINAKNSYGGYVGFSLFAASPMSATTLRKGGRYAEVDELSNVGLRAGCSGN